MSKKYWMLLLLLATALAVLSLIVSVARAQDVLSASNTVELRIGNDTYVLFFSVRSPIFVPTENRIALDIQGVLVYATSNKPVFVVANIELGGINIASAIFGYYSFNRPSRLVHIEAVVPPILAEQIKDKVEPSFITLHVKAYRNSTSTASTVKIPIILTKVTPMLQLSASFQNGLPYAVAIVGAKPYTLINIRVTNSGSIVIHNVNVFIKIDNQSVLTKHVTDILLPGNSTTVSARLPIPLKPGTYSVSIIAQAVAGIKEVETSSNLVLIVLPRISLALSVLNSTTVIEGQKICFKVESSYVPGYVRPSIAIDIETEPQHWDTVSIIQNATSTTYCWKTPILGLGHEKTYRIRARLILSIYGLQYQVKSNTVQVTVLPLQSIVRYASLQVIAEKTTIYPAENIKLNIMLSPSAPACLPAIVEKYSMQTASWEALSTVEVCNGEGFFSYPASNLGNGAQKIRAVLRIGNFIITSNVITINIVKQPLVIAKLVPSTAAPNATTTLVVHIERLVDSYKLIVRPSWTNATISLTGTGDIRLPIRVPGMKGTYHVYVKAVIDGYSIEKDLLLRVANVTASLLVKPEIIKAGETKNITVTVFTIPSINATASVKLLGKEGTLAIKKLDVINGKGITSIPAPSKPGNYTVIVSIPQYKIDISRSIKVIQVIYGMTLSVNATSVTPGSKIKADVTITPAPKAPVNVVIMVRQSGGAWEVVASGLATNGRATVVFSAPSQPGQYEVRASAPQLKANSNIVRLVVAQGTKTMPPRTLQVYAIIGIVAAAALAWSIRSIRR